MKYELIRGCVDNVHYIGRFEKEMKSTVQYRGTEHHRTCVIRESKGEGGVYM